MITKKRNSFINGAISPQMIANSISKHSTKTEIGGHSIFLGQVRNDEINGKEVQAIEYTSYQDMAEAKLEEIREDIFSKYEITCLHLHHSLGIVKKGEICLFAFTSSAHRKAAIDACTELVERVKKEVPIWGKELFEDNSHQWKENIL